MFAAGHPVTDQALDPVLSVKSVSKSYRRGRHELRVLVDASLDVEVGEHVAVLGQHGAGKTTLLKVAAGLEAPDDGSVRVGGRSLATLSDAELSRLLSGQVAWVQRSGPRSRVPVLDYVALPVLIAHGEREAYARARDALARVGMKECAQAQWGTLSDWERAHVAIAQGVVRRPRLLLIDDLLTSLGIGETDEVTTMVRTLAQELRLGVLMSVLDVPAGLRCDRIVSLAGGRLSQPPRRPADDGNVIDLLSRERHA